MIQFIFISYISFYLHSTITLYYAVNICRDVSQIRCGLIYQDKLRLFYQQAKIKISQIRSINSNK